ncbi:GPH family glycoside/pentoside/hexuronide:cation symporter [Nonomuraea thailandensis]|uniref:GPH family glycoside/pentoside/hexuronide:cation symporter n=1 Tax=Nonomuraea thailandensis TaxID=1188745 RepID=A0A9X2K1T4_9ACTN|nr:MFS transporter [Nonomuraea thailandensis]MCP2357622.1 GPH family glycoside/pentoside/hexuronide:cation symporter [Nonomuraea thailandensis]
MSQPVTVPGPGRTPAWRYAIGMFGTSIPINMIKGSMILYYVDILGLDVRAYGAVMVIYAVIDALDNPLLGHLSDRTRTRFGRRRPWLLVGAPMLAACMIAFFSAPASLEGMGLVLWFAVFAILCEAFDSMLNANYGALLPELYPRERDRAVANSLRQGFQLVALVISLAVTPLLTTSVFGTEESTEGFRTTAIVYGAIAVAVIVFMALSARERPRYSTSERPRLLASIWSIVRNPMFWTVGLTGACYGIAMALVLSGIQLYVRYSLGLPVGDALYLQGVVILVSAAGLAVWTRVVARRGALWTWRLAFAVLAISFAVLFLATDLVTAIAAGVLVGAGWSGMLATNDLIVARVLDADATRNGEHREGLFLSAFGFFSRLNGIVTGLALTSLGVFFGYNSGADPGADPGLAFRVYLCVYPFVLTAIGAVAARFVSVPIETPPEAGEPASPPPPGPGGEPVAPPPGSGGEPVAPQTGDSGSEGPR